jgi:glutamate racemase
MPPARGGCVSKRVLIFDSGVGGLSVYDEIRRVLPNLDYIYLFDNAKFPYGELPAHELVHRCCGLISRVVARHPVDLVVIACNTASTQVLPSLRTLLSVPVVGVVPAIKPAAKLTKNGCIGLLATPATVSRPYTEKLILEFAAHHRVLRCGSTELVIQAERKLAGEPVDQARIHEILAPWREAEISPDTIVLGCTHFPLLKEEILHALPGTMLVDSGSAVARRVQSLVGGVNDAEDGGSWAYCTRLDTKARLLQTALQSYGLESLIEWSE